jgi:glycosyltransferase involved in cell wall biosynthesis
MRSGTAPICFVGPLPPPTHGMANVNAEMLVRLREHTDVFAINTSPGLQNGFVRHIVKIGRALSAVPRMIAARAGGAKTFYASVDDGVGGILTGMFALLARLLGYRVFLHHHSFRYVDATTRIMRWIAASAGPGGWHVVLCPRMAEIFAARYGVRKIMVAPNAVPEPEAASRSVRDDDDPRLVLGLLSNLMFDKGVREFIETVESARAAGLAVRGILAGPAWNTEVEECIQAALKRNGDALTWLGPVFGEAKARFFNEVDFFVFPTRYPAEAYPLVLVEALVRGCAVIATGRGCISALGHLASVQVIEPNVDFAVEALAWLSHQPRGRTVRRDLARAEGLALNRENRNARDSVMARLIGFDMPPGASEISR